MKNMLLMLCIKNFESKELSIAYGSVMPQCLFTLLRATKVYTTKDIERFNTSFIVIDEPCINAIKDLEKINDIYMLNYNYGSNLLNYELIDLIEKIKNWQV